MVQSLPFQTVKHAVSTLDAQPSGEHGGILILITGALLVSRNFDELRANRKYCCGTIISDADENL